MSIGVAVIIALVALAITFAISGAAFAGQR